MNSQFDGKVAAGADRGSSPESDWRQPNSFAQRGYHCGTSRDAGGKNSTRRFAKLRQSATGIQGDVSRKEDIDKVFQTIREQEGKLDILFANAGIGEFAPLGQITEEHFDKQFQRQRQGHTLHGSGRIASDVSGQRDCPERLAGFH